MSRGFRSPNFGEELSAGAVARSPLREHHREAGAHFVVRSGWEVAAHFGSVATEIATCRAACGIGDSSEIGKLEIQASPKALQACLAAAVTVPPLLGEAREQAGTWWCPVHAERALVLAPTDKTRRLRQSLERWLRPSGGTVVDVTSGFTAIDLVGPRARDLLARLTAIDTRDESMAVSSFRPGSIARVPAMVLRKSHDRFLILCGSAHAEYMWVSCHDAGRPLGATHVGTETLARLDATGKARGLARA